MSLGRSHPSGGRGRLCDRESLRLAKDSQTQSVPESVTAAANYQEVVTPSLNSNEVLKGTVANDTGQAVIYTADSGPYSAGATCHSFATNNTTTNWQMTISPSGNFTLTCHFGA